MSKKEEKYNMPTYLNVSMTDWIFMASSHLDDLKDWYTEREQSDANKNGRRYWAGMRSEIEKLQHIGDKLSDALKGRPNI